VLDDRPPFSPPPLGGAWKARSVSFAPFHARVYKRFPSFGRSPFSAFFTDAQPILFPPPLPTMGPVRVRNFRRQPASARMGVPHFPLIGVVFLSPLVALTVFSFCASARCPSVGLPLPFFPIRCSSPGSSFAVLFLFRSSPVFRLDFLADVPDVGALFVSGAGPSLSATYFSFLVPPPPIGNVPGFCPPRLFHLGAPPLAIGAPPLPLAAPASWPYNLSPPPFPPSPSFPAEWSNEPALLFFFRFRRPPVGPFTNRSAGTFPFPLRCQEPSILKPTLLLLPSSKGRGQMDSESVIPTTVAMRLPRPPSTPRGVRRVSGCFIPSETRTLLPPHVIDVGESPEYPPLNSA